MENVKYKSVFMAYIQQKNNTPSSEEAGCWKKIVRT